MKHLRAAALLLLAVASPAAFSQAPPNTLTPQEASEGWILLFDGQSMFGWTAEGKAQWRIADGALISDAGEYGWLRTNSQFADYVLKLEFRTAGDGNSGIFLRSARQGEPHKTGYELQIFDTHPEFPTGSLVGHIAAKDRVKIQPGRWMTYEIEVTGNHFLVKLDGKRVLFGRDDKATVGHIGLQHNKDKSIEFRNIKLKPLGLQSLFNGKDLSGWQVVDSPRKPANPPEWSVKDGLLHVEKGPGQIETERTFANFVLQLDVRANSTDPNFHPNSGVFFRGRPGGYWSGYESQIRNEFKEGDRSQPVDFGTGGIYRHQPARRVAGSDNEFFTKTVVAHGRHLAVWINGFPVSDLEDENPEGSDVRKKQAVLTAGPFSLQAHDPKTNLDFRKIQAVELPK